MAIGALNWGIIGVGGFFGSSWNVLEMIFGGIPVLLMIIYTLIGLSAIWVCCPYSSCKDGACKSCAGGVCEAHGKGMEM